MGDRVSDGDAHSGRLAGLVREWDAAHRARFKSGGVVVLDAAVGQINAHADDAGLYDAVEQAQAAKSSSVANCNESPVPESGDGVEVERVVGDALALGRGELTVEQVTSARAIGPEWDQVFEIGDDAARQIDAAARDGDGFALVRAHLVGLEVGRVGFAQAERLAGGRIAHEQRAGARRADGVVRAVEAAHVFGVGSRDRHGDEVSVARPVEEVAHGGADASA